MAFFSRVEGADFADGAAVAKHDDALSQGRRTSTRIRRPEQDRNAALR